MNIGEICSREVYVFGPEETLADAAAEMERRHVGAVVVIEHEGDCVRPIGIVTDRDVVRGQISRRADLFSIAIKDVMTARPLTVNESCGVTEAIGQMSARGVRRAPVVNSSGDLVGIVTFDDLLPVVVEEIGALARLLATQARRERAIVPAPKTGSTP